MPRLNLAPTKSHLLDLKRQLAFAREGYELLEQKRQILIFELMHRIHRASEIEANMRETMLAAYSSLEQATLDIGSYALERLAGGTNSGHDFSVITQHLMGISLPKVTTNVQPGSVAFGFCDSSAHVDDARERFYTIVPILAELAELETAVLRLANELKKTQRRCNALSKIFIPAFEETITFIASTLEERERESLIILKMIRNRLRESRRYL